MNDPFGQSEVGIVLLGKNQHLVARRYGREQVGAECFLEGGCKLRSQHTGGGERVFGLDGCVLDDLIFASHKGGLHPLEDLRSGLQGLFLNHGIGHVDGFFLLAGEGLYFATHDAGDGQNRPLRTLDRATHFVIHERRFDEEGPLVGEER